VFRAGEYYHLYNPGNNYQNVFFEPDNYRFFLRRLHRYLQPEAVEVVSYCLMPNHYHLLVHLVTDDLSSLMQPFLLSYTKAINKRYGRVGLLFQGRFQAVRVDRDEYLVHLSRYIHLNPVAAKLVEQPEDWEFSGYRAD
jgi:putative transposase